MMTCKLNFLTRVAITLLMISSAAADEKQREEFFEQHVRPLLLERCIECHGPQKQEGDVRLDRRDDVLKGIISDTPLVDPADLQASRLLQVIQHAEDDIQMPPSSKLSDQQIAVLQQWVADGAVWPQHADLEADAKRRAERWRDHWAFQPAVMPDLSEVVEGTNPVEYFIQRKLRQKNLQPSDPADIRTVVRRFSFAIVGLPPALTDYEDATAAEAAGRRSEWLAEYADRLLASDQFGPRWGRYWLDVARYADTKGYVFQEDREYPDAWKYREWVIRALNADMPYDEFLKRQLVADQMTGADDPSQLAAMGYLTLGRRFLNNKHDIIDDRIDVTIRGMMGLTAACARCHDHKFDPIPTADYYSLYGIFDSSDEPKNEPSTLRLVDRDKPVEPVVFVRGQPGNRGERVARRFLTALSGSDAPAFQKGSGRLELAESISSDENPLTARVAVNRIWMHLFGRGLVDSPSDFGVRTDPPSHPELLDYLAVSFVQNQWSTKSIIRQIVLSSTFQQSSDQRMDAQPDDPENRLLSRMNRRRLDFEALRDALLFVSGELDATVGGPSIDITKADAPGRRTVYARIDRQNLPGVFRTFDLANPDAHAPQRFETTVPQQALFQWNNEFAMSTAQAVARRTADGSTDLHQRIGRLFLTVLQRPATEAETQAAAEFINWFETEQTAASARSGWSYGYGTLDEAAAVVKHFSRFEHFRKGNWQGGREFPDAALRYLMLNRSGGHTGENIERCAVRRWQTDVACTIAVTSQLGHASEQGDGVRGRLVLSSGKIIADAVIHNSTASMDVSEIALKPGEWVDFVTDCRTSSSFDSFTWKIQLTQSVSGNVLQSWNSESDFGREQSQPLLDAWSQLAQTLLLTNEFAFID